MLSCKVSVTIITNKITTTIISIILKEGKGGTLLPLFVCLCASREEDWGERNHIDQGSQYYAITITITITITIIMTIIIVIIIKDQTTGHQRW